MTLQFTKHGKERAKQRQITEQMIRNTINKLNNINSIKNRKVYITDRTLSYTIVADIQKNKIHIITIITEKGVINITGRNPAIKIVS